MSILVVDIMDFALAAVVAVVVVVVDNVTALFGIIAVLENRIFYEIHLNRLHIVECIFEKDYSDHRMAGVGMRYNMG